MSACFAPPRPPRPRLRVLGVVLAGLTGLTGCADFPELDAPLAAAEAETGATFPPLVPVEALLAEVPPQAITPAAQSSLDARRSALDARAEALRGTGLEPETRDRMRAGVSAGQP
jgi:hypothetical protein